MSDRRPRFQVRHATNSLADDAASVTREHSWLWDDIYDDVTPAAARAPRPASSDESEWETQQVPSLEPVVIAPTEELDVGRIGDFRVALSDAAREAAKRVVVDLTAVSFIDSSGLSALLEVQKRLRREKRQLAVVAPDGTAVAVILTLEGLRGRLEIFETRQAALDA